MINATFVTGKTCVGKTTWTRDKQHVVRTSAAALAIMSADDMAQATNPAAPERAESAVRTIVNAALTEAAEQGHDVIFDSFPRSADQLAWLEDKCNDIKPWARVQVAYAICAPDIKRGRIEKRLSEQPDRGNLLRARLAAEDAVFSNLLERLMVSPIPTVIVDLTTDPPDMRSLDRNLSLEVMFRSHGQFNDMVMAKFGLSTDRLINGASTLAEMEPYSDNGVWCRRYLRAARNEIDEALRELPDEWWTKDKASLPKLREELIDVWHFLMSAALAAGMGPAEFAREYFRKLGINVSRQQRAGGYIKRPAGGGVPFVSGESSA